ncbi:hypothetical protein C7212DRAFT_346713 [Tuber magnatum]|uniref:G domain-containing protein n=1 Tax=Tuber magnatum TaxID=42249 RepID=A0A317SJ43_9PEZI|nr:hypothetical protein C7212DRAFT_346713 [Tuber magnatum]
MIDHHQTVRGALTLQMAGPGENWSGYGDISRAASPGRNRDTRSWHRQAHHKRSTINKRPACLKWLITHRNLTTGISAGSLNTLHRSGTGKSYFIKEVSGNSEVALSGDLYSWARVTLVDTPGFDNAIRSDTEILREIADWTSVTYGEKRLLSGIIYLHPITHSRMEGSALKNLRMFQSLYGRKFLKNIFLAKTQWSSADPAKGQVRENSLRNGDFWGGLIDKGPLSRDSMALENPDWSLSAD